jgi:hypothetical protein
LCFGQCLKALHFHTERDRERESEREMPEAESLGFSIFFIFSGL